MTVNLIKRQMEACYLEVVLKKDQLLGLSQLLWARWKKNRISQKLTGEGRPITRLHRHRGEVKIQLLNIRGEHQVPAALPPGNTRYPLYRLLGGPV